MARPEDPRFRSSTNVAPLESVTVVIMESFSVKYSVEVISGLPNSCVSYVGSDLSATALQSE